MNWRKILQSENGAVAALLAVLLGSGVLVISVGLVVDGGRLFLERRVLQSSADTVSVTLAQACANYDLKPDSALAADCQNPPTAIATNMNLSEFARVPFDQNQTEAYLACGISANLQVCPGTSIGQYDCKAPTDSSNGQSFSHVVRAYTRTTQTGIEGGTALYPLFAPLLPASPEGTRLAACSQAAWVFRSIANTPNATYMPFAISACDFSESARVIVGYQSGGSSCSSMVDHAGRSTSCGSTACQGGVVGFNYTNLSGCNSVSGGKLSITGVTLTGTVPPSSVCVKATIGSSPSPGVTNLRNAILGTFSNSNTPESVYTVPIFDHVTKPGANNIISIVGFGYFKLLGYKFPGGLVYPTSSAPTWPSTCGQTGGSGNTWCIWGRFEPHVYSNSPSSELTEIGRPNFWDGTFAVKRIP